MRAVTQGLAEAIVSERDANGPFLELPSTGRRLGFAPREALEWLVLTGALDSLCPSRRQTIWSLPAIHRVPDTQRGATKLQRGQCGIELEIHSLLPPDLPDFLEDEKEQQEWQVLGFSPRRHPLRHQREELARRGIQPCIALQACADGETLTVAGLSLMPHRPPVPSGKIVVFVSLEDETGLAQVMVLPAVYERWGAFADGAGAGDSGACSSSGYRQYPHRRQPPGDLIYCNRKGRFSRTSTALLAAWFSGR